MSPPQEEARRELPPTACPDTVLERAAILEFCEGLLCKAADALALAEFDHPAAKAFSQGGTS
jgi:hypothetical protein